METPTAKRHTRRDFIKASGTGLLGLTLAHKLGAHPTLGTKIVEIRVKRMPLTAMI